MCVIFRHRVSRHFVRGIKQGHLKELMDVTIHNRDSFLNVVAEQLGRPRRKDVKRPRWSLQPQWGVHKDLSQDELVDVLEKQCRVIHTTFKRTHVDELPDVLRETVNDYNGKSIIIPNDKRHDDYGLIPLFKAFEEGGRIVH